VLAPRTLTLTRDYSFDEEALLAKQHEEEFLREALARDLVTQVMRSLASL
jgi:LPS-assembly lipoprotein